MKFKKRILKPGTYNAKGLDGTRKQVVATPDRIKHWADTFNKMREAGLNIPAPYRHDPNSLPKDKPETSADNGGFWDKLEVDSDGYLVGILDTPDGDKINTRVKEVSPLFRDWTDGLNREWKDAPVHIALVTHPVVPGQEEFQPIYDANDEAIAAAIFMSLDDFQMADEPDKGKKPNENPDSQPGSGTGNTASAPKSGISLKDAVQALRALDPPVDLGDDCNLDNILERIVVACRAIKSHSGGEESEGGPPREQPTPIAMGETMSTVDTTGKTALAFATNLARKDYNARIDALLKSNRMTPDYKKKVVDPMLTGFELSLDAEGKPAKNSLDHVIEALEALPVGHSLNDSGAAFGGLTEQQHPQLGDEELTEEGIEKIVNLQLNRGDFSLKRGS